MLVAEDDEVLQECLAGVGGECAIVLEEEGGEVGGKVCGLLWVADGNLCDEGDELSEVGGVVVGADEEELAAAVVVVVLLDELVPVARRIAFDEVLELRQMEHTVSHGTKQRSIRLVIHPTATLSPPSSPSVLARCPAHPPRAHRRDHPVHALAVHLAHPRVLASLPAAPTRPRSACPSPTPGSASCPSSAARSVLECDRHPAAPCVSAPA